MKTNNRVNAYILRGSTIALLFSCVIVALGSAVNLAAHPRKAAALHDTVFGANGHQSRKLSFAERVGYQRAIEEVYWRHRIWPKERRDPKPSLGAMMSQAQLEKKVEDYLRKSQRLEDYWQTPITADQLQTEMERMASDTRQPGVLQELFEALGNDPFIIAECLARPVLVERLGTTDPVAAIVAPAAVVVATPLRGVARNVPQARDYSERQAAQVPGKLPAIDSTRKAFGVRVNGLHLPVIGSPSGMCSGPIWTPTSEDHPPSERLRHTAVWTGTEMIVWGGYSAPNYLNTGGRYNPSTDSWAATSATNAPERRTDHTAVWTGSEMIVWGGFHDFPAAWLNTGGRYDPITDSWTPTNTVRAPEARSRHTAVWTGSEMIVWGGWVDFPATWFDTGGRYDPIADRWIVTSTAGAPEARSRHTAVWTGSEMIVWGGDTNSDIPLNTGGRYNPVANSWTATSTTDAPLGRYGHQAVSTDSEMIVWGGYSPSPPTYFNTGGRYNLSTDSWTPTSTARAPDARAAFTAIWSGVEMIVWGGWNVGIGPMNTGAGYDPISDRWLSTSVVGAPDPRYSHSAVWTESEMIVWGGAVVAGPSATPVKTGGRYCPQADSHPIRRYHDPLGPPVPLPRPFPPPQLTPSPSPSASGRPTPAPRP